MSMRVSGVFSAYEVYQTQQTSNINRLSRAEEKKDIVALSGHAKDYQVATKAVHNAPDIRYDKVAEIQRRIESGSYHVSSTDVAGKILGTV